MNMHKNALKRQADRIEAVLAVREVPARVTGGTVTPRRVRFQALPAIGAKISRIKGLSEELAAALDASSCRVSRRGAVVDIEVLRNDPQPVRLLPMHRQLTEDTDGKYHSKSGDVLPVTALLGLAEDGAPLLIRLPSSDVRHILIAGMEGAGKTTLLRSIVTSLAMANSPNDLAFLFLGDGLPGVVHAIEKTGHEAHQIERIGAVLRAAIRMAGKRVVFIGDDATGGDEKVAAKLSHSMGKERLHFVLAWDGVPPEEISRLFKVRLVGQMTSIEGARIATGQSDTGAERLLGRGDFLAVAEGRVIRFQVAHVSPEEIATHVRISSRN